MGEGTGLGRAVGMAGMPPAVVAGFMVDGMMDVTAAVLSGGVDMGRIWAAAELGWVGWGEIGKGGMWVMGLPSAMCCNEARERVAGVAGVAGVASGATEDGSRLVLPPSNTDPTAAISRAMIGSGIVVGGANKSTGSSGSRYK